MSNRELIEQIKELALAQSTHTAIPLEAPASAEEIAEAEKLLGFKLPELLEDLYTQVANGGFGPAYGLLGVPRPPRPSNPLFTPDRPKFEVTSGESDTPFENVAPYTPFGTNTPQPKPARRPRHKRIYYDFARAYRECQNNFEDLWPTQLLPIMNLGNNCDSMDTFVCVDCKVSQHLVFSVFDCYDHEAVFKDRKDAQPLTEFLKMWVAGDGDRLSRCGEFDCNCWRRVTS